MKKQVHLYYSGRVQGVGFRFTAQRLAEELSVSGWVKNLDDERVELVAEASEDILNIFLSRINDTFNRYISNKQENWIPAKGEFKSFEVKF